VVTTRLAEAGEGIRVRRVDLAPAVPAGEGATAADAGEDVPPAKGEAAPDAPATEPS
jgi:hypothetical protein